MRLNKKIPEPKPTAEPQKSVKERKNLAPIFQNPKERNDIEGKKQKKTEKNRKNRKVKNIHRWFRQC